MSPIREVCLSLNDVEEMISAFEHKYGVLSPDFFNNTKIKQELPEDDVFEWEALIYHRAALRATSEQVQSVYLSRLGHTSPEQRSHAEKESQQEALAA
jgi:hypothetical protein